MIPANLHPQEEDRLAELLKFEVLDTSDESCFDELTELASNICGTPISLISLIDSQRQWFKSRVGLDARETPKDLAFCAHAILQKDIFEIPNALKDERFVDNPLVTESPDIRFYAGMPLITSSGLPIGTLCVIDTQPKTLNTEQKRALEILAKQVISQLEIRLHARKMQRMNKEREKFYGILAHDLKSPFNGVLGLSRLLVNSAEKFDAQKITDYSKEILDSSLKIYQILDEILQWTEHCISTGKPVLKSFKIKTCIEDSTALLSESIKAKDLKVKVQVGESIEAKGNSALFKTAVRNLLSNAIKYSPKGGSILMRASNKEQNMHFSIQDEGEGIPDALQKHLFENTVTSKVGTLGEAGHGLGLHLTHELIVLQQGHIWLDENYHQGTLIHCVLPLS